MPRKKNHLQLYADECFPMLSVTHLRSLGYSIEHAFDRGNIRKSDFFHFKEAKKIGKVLITLDRDFLFIKDEYLNNSPGVIVLSGGTPVPKNINLLSEIVMKYISKEYAKDSYIQVTRDKITKKKNGVLASKKM